MAKLLGFQKRSGTGEASSAQMLRIIEKTYLNRTATGEFSNEAEVQGFIDALSTLPQTADVMEKTAEMQNKKLQITTRQGDILNSKALFEDNLNDALRVEARNNYKDLPMLVGNYMNVYADAEEKIDTYIADNVYKRYGSSAEVPQDLITLKNSIKDKARYYSTLTAMMSTPGGMESLNVDALAVKVQTNPMTGNIISLDVVPRGEVSDEFLETDIKAKLADGAPAVTIYVNGQDDKTTELGTRTKYARLGSIEFRGTGKLDGGKEEKKDREKELGDDYGIGQLKAQNEPRGLRDWLKGWFTETDAEVANKGLKSARDEGTSFQDFNFDGNDIPAKSVVRKGNRLYFQQDNGDVSEFDGATLREKQDNAKRYLKQMGIDENKANVPLYADDVYFVAPDGSSRIKEKIGADYFTPSLPSSGTTSMMTPFQPSTTMASSAPENSNLLSSFFANKNRMSKPNTEMTTTTPAIVESGKGFFRKMIG